MGTSALIACRLLPFCFAYLADKNTVDISQRPLTPRGNMTGDEEGKTDEGAAAAAAQPTDREREDVVWLNAIAIRLV